MRLLVGYQSNFFFQKFQINLFLYLNFKKEQTKYLIKESCE